MTFTLIGAPRTKNTGKISTKGYRWRVFPSKPYATWFKNATKQLPIAMLAARAAGYTLPIAAKVSVGAVFYRDRDSGDLDRYLVGVGDWLQRNGVIANDRQIIAWDGSRLELDYKRPRVEIEITVCRPNTSGGKQ